MGGIAFAVLWQRDLDIVSRGFWLRFGLPHLTQSFVSTIAADVIVGPIPTSTPHRILAPILGAPQGEQSPLNEWFLAVRSGLPTVVDEVKEV